MKKMNKKGFTLAELLIVIAIMAILIAIAIPAFGAQLENARISADTAVARTANELAYGEYLLNHSNQAIATTDEIVYTFDRDAENNLYISGHKCDTADTKFDKTKCNGENTAAGLGVKPQSSKLSTVASLTVTISNGQIKANSWMDVLTT